MKKEYSIHNTVMIF